MESCLLDRLKHDKEELQLFTHALTLLATNGWEQTQSTTFGQGALEAVCSWFAIPLEKAGVDCSLALDEWNDMVEYAKTYLDLVTQDYKAVWWKLYNGGFAFKWQNILAIVELLFCLPLSNGHLERVFSQLKLIKTKQTNKALHNFLLISSIGNGFNTSRPCSQSHAKQMYSI